MTSQTLINARTVAEAVRRLHFNIEPSIGLTLRPIGIVLTDAVLQAGMNYTHVVLPRLEYLEMRYQVHLDQLSKFDILIKSLGAPTVLCWKASAKTNRLTAWIAEFRQQAVETTEDLRRWLTTTEASSILQRLPGMGDKTVSYLQGLCGIDCVAVDRHIRAFVAQCGISDSDYIEVQKIVHYAADLLSVGRRDLDRSIWRSFAQH